VQAKLLTSCKNKQQPHHYAALHTVHSCGLLPLCLADVHNRKHTQKKRTEQSAVWVRTRMNHVSVGGPGSSQGKGEFWEEHLLVHYKVQGISRVSQLSGRWQQQPAFHRFLPRPMATLSWFTGLFSAFLYVITKLLCKWFPSVTANLQQRPSNMTYNVKVNQHLILIITLIMSMVLSSRRKPLREFTRFICQF